MMISECAYPAMPGKAFSCGRGASQLLELSGTAECPDTKADTRHQKTQRVPRSAHAWMHAGAKVLAVVIEAYNFYIRYSGAGSKNTGFVLSLIVVCILLFSGWKGWGMVYRHHVAVSDVAERPH
jgi:uncharacterized membrane protein